MYANAQFIKDNPDGEASTIRVEIEGVPSFVPVFPGNRDYDAITKLVADGSLTIAPAADPFPQKKESARK